MKKKYLNILFIPFFIILFDGCDKEQNLQSGLSENDPWGMPLRRRENELFSGNKVYNPSFEQGRFFRDHLNTFEIDGWKEITQKGDEVEWVDVSRDKYSRQDVFFGNRAVKITRRNVHETEEQGAGLISDYIKVIPGNYSLKYYIRLKNIRSHKSRFGSRLMDAIHIRIHYYDKNKIEISNDMVSPVDGTKFDNGFKSFQFSGFWKIDSLDWTHARGISHKHPFFNGNIPEETRYVKLFFGLKGQGSMWIDNVSLNYTKHNFTLDERLSQFTKKKYKPTDLVIPKPQKIEPGESVSFYNPVNPNNKPAIVLPDNPDEVTLSAAERLKKKLQQLITSAGETNNVNISVLTDDKALNPDEYSLVFAIGNNALTRKHTTTQKKTIAKNHPQGYFITRQNDNSNVIILKGTNPIGNLYAVNTINQLLADSNLVYHHAEIEDFPDYQNRVLVTNMNTTKQSGQLELFESLKFNHLFWDVDLTNLTQTTLSNTLEKIQEQQGRKELTTIKQGIAVNPYKPIIGDSKELSVVTDKYDYSRLEQFIKEASDKNFDDIIIHLENQADSSGYTEECFEFSDILENTSSYKSLCDIHADLINQVNEWNPSSKIYFLPAWNSTDCIIKSNGRGEFYVNELFRKVSPDIAFLWRGATKTPRVIDNIEVYHIEKISGKEPVFYCNDIHPVSQTSKSNQLTNNPQNLQVHSIFQNFELVLPDNFFNTSQYGTFLTRLDGTEGTILNQIKLATLANYLWNTDEFDSDKALYIALVAYFGKEGALKLIEFNQLYMNLSEICLRMREEGPRRKDTKIAEQYFNRLDDLMKEIKTTFENNKLKTELSQLKNSLYKAYNQNVK
ncbi:MAG: glycoside hydrolase family 20 zincin-like fold domain-containing protein [Bacteroidales bacterium]